MAKEITVTIDEGGDIVVTTSGYTGKSCQDATRQLEAALGATTGDKPTAEMHKPITNTMKVGQKS